MQFIIYYDIFFIFLFMLFTAERCVSPDGAITVCSCITNVAMGFEKETSKLWLSQRILESHSLKILCSSFFSPPVHPPFSFFISHLHPPALSLLLSPPLPCLPCDFHTNEAKKGKERGAGSVEVRHRTGTESRICQQPKKETPGFIVFTPEERRRTEGWTTKTRSGRE